MKSHINYLFIFVPLMLAGAGCSIDASKVEGRPGFTWSKDITCSIINSTDKRDKGINFRLQGLDTDTPKMTFIDKDYSLTEDMKKIHDSKDYLAIEQISVFGGTDTLQIDKKTGIFARGNTTNVTGPFSSSEKGNCI